MEKLQKHSNQGDKGEKSRKNIVGSNGNRRGSKRKVGRPKNKMKRIDDLVKQSEQIVTDSGAFVFPQDRRSVLDLDEIVRDHMKKISEIGAKNGKEICIVSSDDDVDQNHEYDHKVKEIIVSRDDDDGDQSIARSWPKTRKKSVVEKDDEEICKTLSRVPSNKEKGKDGLISP
ncbi:hypothetical protein POM88_022233 [Heracleum sosnowskyi]|uniref:Uncharacterized protein n=1 Tax=Heracleum sosnowskyi TaxID=360622 RepID=A0AAD8MUP0_9APIA|nr:hypothetical protein POM88_022233 [Heracleum sosnowskyi]